MPTGRFTVSAEHEGDRLDVFVAECLPELSRSQAQRLIGEGAVSIDGARADKSSRALGSGQQVEIEIRRRTAETDLVAEPIPLDVLYEDDDLAVIDKPADLVVHPAPGNRTGTLVHALLHRYGDRLSSISGGGRPGIVHRLDKGTTGVIVVALSDVAHQRLARQFAERTVSKTYLAVAYGCPADNEGRIDVALGRDRQDRKKISALTNTPRPAQTDWKVLERLAGLCLVRLQPRTGRTHQIRAHMACLRHPLVGDDLYAGRQWRGIQDPTIRKAVSSFGRPALHAAELEIDHPTSGKRLHFEAPLPADLQALLDLLRHHATPGLSNT